MLIESPRHTPADIAAWKRLERYDQKIAATNHLDRIEAKAVQTIRAFLADNDGTDYASMSWGKDSVVTAHLTWLADPSCLLRRIRVADWEPPETDWTRDAFLAEHGGIRYAETVYDGIVPQRGEPGFEEVHSDPKRKPTNIMKLVSGRYISGVRAEESAMRKQSLQWHGISTAHTCRPIITWTATDVFAYLESRALPVHPTYAMSYGGHLDRRWLRVYILGSTKPSVRRDNESWEDDYYGDVLAAARRARAHLWESLNGSGRSA